MTKDVDALIAAFVEVTWEVKRSSRSKGSLEIIVRARRRPGAMYRLNVFHAIER
jgi:hypothetical protein